MESRSSSELSGWICFCFTLWNCTCGICYLLSVLCCTTGIHHFVAEPNLRHLDCPYSSPLGLRDLSLPHHANVNNLIDELRLGQLNCLLRQPGRGRVTVLKQWDIHRSLCLLNHKHMSLHYHKNVCSVLFEILLGCGKSLPLVEQHRGYLQLLN